MKFASLAALVAALGLLAAGCSSQAPSNPTPPPTAKDQVQLDSPPMSQGGRMPDEQASPGDKAKLDKLAKEYDAAKAALAKTPNDAKAKEKFSSIGALYGHESMMAPDSVLDRKVKYKQALRIYREVLKVDPSNSVAKGESDTIIGIYKSMGRPIPED